MVRENIDDLGMNSSKVSWKSSALSLSKMFLPLDAADRIIGPPSKGNGNGSPRDLAGRVSRSGEREHRRSRDGPAKTLQDVIGPRTLQGVYLRGIMTCVRVEGDVKDNLVIRYLER